MKTGSNIRQRADGRFEARYIKSRDENGRIIYGYCYAKSFKEAAEKRAVALGMIEKPQTKPFRRMNLLILGAGGQGLVVKEIAESIRVFHKIAFLDDSPNSHAIGRCSDCARFLSEYPIAIPSVGNCELRMKWIDILNQAGFIVPTLIDPNATVSPSASIDCGTLIEPKATIGAKAKIGVGCIISAGAIIERDVTITDGTHVRCGETVRKESN